MIRYGIRKGSGSHSVPIGTGHTIFTFKLWTARLYSVTFRTQPRVELGSPKLVLDNLSIPEFKILTDRTYYDVSKDGKNFVMEFNDETRGRGKNLVIVQNWLEELKRLVPSK